MSNFVLFTFSNESDQLAFVNELDKLATKSAIVKKALASKNINRETILAAVSNSKTYAVFVSGKEILKGSLDQCTKKFQFETASHSAGVQLKEYNPAKESWKPIKSRTYGK
jgi:hypothetical protein